LISHFNKLKKVDSNLYNKIISLPFVTSSTKFQNIFKETKESQHIPDKQLEYFKMKLKSKDLWAKCYLKKGFIGEFPQHSGLKASMRNKSLL